MKTIYKALIAFLTISMIIGTASANPINWNSFDIASQETVQFDEQAPTQGIDIISDGHTHQNPSGGHQYTKGTLTIPINEGTYGIIEIGAFQYEDIEIT